MARNSFQLPRTRYASHSHTSQAAHTHISCAQRIARTYPYHLTLSTVSLLLGVHAAYSDPVSFITKQLPVTGTAELTSVPASAVIVAYSLGSLFSVLALFSVLCTFVTREAKVTKYYLAILACGDIGHLYANYKGMGREILLNFGDYNEVMVGNVWITIFLYVNRIATLAGAFGRIGQKA